MLLAFGVFAWSNRAAKALPNLSGGRGDVLAETMSLFLISSDTFSLCLSIFLSLFLFRQFAAQTSFGFWVKLRAGEQGEGGCSLC